MKVTRFVPLLAVAALGLAACGSDSSSDSATTDAPAASAAPADTTAEATTPAETTPAGTDAGTPADAAGLQLIETSLGSVLADGGGFTLYIFKPDAQGDSTCYDQCADNWPFAPEVSDVGDGLDASLLGTTERTTGETQATYNGWPLYTFGGDPGPGLTNGQGIGDSWYVIDATGTARQRLTSVNDRASNDRAGNSGTTTDRARSDGARVGLLNDEPHRLPGSEELARDLYLAHGPALEHWSRGRFDDAQVAEEVVQEVVLAAWRKYDQFDPARGSERAWMFGIAHNVAATRHARGRRHLRSVPTATTPEVAVDDAEMTRLVEHSLIVDAMKSLSADHRAVIVAAFWDRLSTREISDRLGVADGTVKSRIHYALRALRSGLEERKVL